MRISDWSSDVCSSDLPLTRGYACFKGLQAKESHHGPNRLLHPLKRNAEGGYDRIPLEQALDEIAEKVSAISEKYGPDSIGTYFGNGASFNSTSFRSEEHTSELQSLMRISYAVFCLKKKNQKQTNKNNLTEH